MVASQDAGKPAGAHRPGDRGSQRTAELSDRGFTAPLAGARLDYRSVQHGDGAGAERRAQARRERRGRIRAPGIGASQAPRCANDFNLSLHGYTRISTVPTPRM